MLRERGRGVVLALLSTVLALAPATAVAASAKTPSGSDVASSTAAAGSAVQQEITPTRRRILPVHKSAADSAASAPRRPARAPGAASTALPAGIGANVQASPATTTDRYSETAVAVDPHDATGQHLAASANFLTGLNDVSFTSTNGGTNWATTSVPVPQSSPTFFSDPGVAYSAGICPPVGGSPHIAYSTLGINLNTGATSVLVTRENTDTTSPITLVVDGSGDFPDKPMIATDPRSGDEGAYVAYDTNPTAAGTGQPLMVAPDPLNCLSGFGTPVQVWNSGGDIGGWPVVGADGTVYLVWDDYCGGTPQTVPTLTVCPKPGGQILFSKSTDQGATWLTTPTTISATTTGFGSILPNYATECTTGCPARPVGPQPQIAIDHSGGARNGVMYVVYGDGSDRQLGASAVPSAHRMHIYLQQSRDGGATWDPRVQIDTGNPNDAWEPTVAVDQSNGNVVVGWYDRRDDSNNHLYRPYFAESLADDSTTHQPVLTAQLPVADTQSDPQVDCNGSGDYQQIAAAAGTAHLVWTDSRSGLPAVFTSAIVEATAATSTFTTAPTGSTLRDPHGTAWVPLPGLANTIDVGANCQAWILGLNAGGTWFFGGPSAGWVSHPGNGTRIAVQAAGLPRLVNSVDGIWRLQSNDVWQQLPGSATEIATGADFSLWVVGINPVGDGHGLWSFNGSGWDQRSGGGERLAVGPDGFPWLVTARDTIWHMDSGGWHLMPGLAHDIAAGADGSVWILGINGVGGGFGTWRWNGTGWDSVPGGGVEIGVGGDGMPWLVNDAGTIWERV